MPKRSAYSMGWIDSSIHDFLAEISVPPLSIKYALLTCLDSCFDLPLMIRKSAALQTLGSQGSIVGKGLLVTTRQLLAAQHQQRIFFGFDEVWFFSLAAIAPKPKRFCLTGADKPTSKLPQELVDWMKDNNCNLALGDGAGLSFVAKLKGVAKYLVEATATETPV